MPSELGDQFYLLFWVFSHSMIAREPLWAIQYNMAFINFFYESSLLFGQVLIKLKVKVSKVLYY